jgi:Rrf2 family protein
VGIRGGYRLARPVALITTGEVIRELDGKLAPMGCVSSYDYEPCEFENACGLKRLWAPARVALVDVLDQTTLADLCT